MTRTPLQIRDPRAGELARELGERLGITMTEAVIRALESLLEAEKARVPLRDRLAEIAAALAGEAADASLHARKPGHRKSGGRG